MENYILFFLIVMILFFNLRQKKLNIILHKIRKKRGKREMTELIMKYIGKECIIYTCSSSTPITCVVKSCNDGWLEIETNNQPEIVNCEYITRIREYPKNKKGKRKSVVLD